MIRWSRVSRASVWILATTTWALWSSRSALTTPTWTPGITIASFSTVCRTSSSRCTSTIPRSPRLRICSAKTIVFPSPVASCTICRRQPRASALPEERTQGLVLGAEARDLGLGGPGGLHQSSRFFPGLLPGAAAGPGPGARLDGGHRHRGLALPSTGEWSEGEVGAHPVGVGRGSAVDPVLGAHQGQRPDDQISVLLDGAQNGNPSS